MNTSSDQKQEPTGPNPKGFEATDRDTLTPFQKLERLASDLFSVRKDQIDAHKPIRPKKKS